MLTTLLRVFFVSAFIATAVAAFNLWTSYKEMSLRLDAAEASIVVLEASRKVLDEVMLNQQALEQKVRSTRSASNKAIENSKSLAGSERIDYLLRVLKDDATARGDSSSGGSSPDVLRSGK